MVTMDMKAALALVLALAVIEEVVARDEIKRISISLEASGAITGPQPLRTITKTITEINTRTLTDIQIKATIITVNTDIVMAIIGIITAMETELLSPEITLKQE
jgi:hypothetical protein